MSRLGRAWFALALSLVLASGTGSSAGAQASVPSTLAGLWVYDGTIARASGIVDGAFAAAIAAQPELFQGFARRRVQATMAPPGRVNVAITGQHVEVRLESTTHRTVVDGDLGAHASVTDPEGSPTVTPTIQGGWLDLMYEGESSEMHQLLSTEPDGSRMHLDFNIESPQLPYVVRYRLDYRRAS